MRNRERFTGLVIALLAVALVMVERDALGQEAGGEAPGTEVHGDRDRPLEFDLRMREIEDRVGELKDDVFRSRARLFMLREQVLQDRVGGARIIINHRDETGGRFVMTRVRYSLDGTPVFTATDATTDFSEMRHREVHRTSAVAGPHNLTVQMNFVGGRFGLFSYMSGYRFEQPGALEFSLEEGQTAEVTVVVHQRGGVNTPFEERLGLRFELRTYDTLDELDDQVAEELEQE